MNTTRKYLRIYIRLGVAALLAAVPGFGASVSYTFSQGGWTDSLGDTGILTGTFTGTPQASGALQLADLTSFQADFHENGPLDQNTFIFNLPNATNFTYDPGTGLLDFAAGSGVSGIQVCSGGADTAQVCFGIRPNSGVGTPLNGFFVDQPKFPQETTRMGPSVTPAAAAVPEPTSIGLFAAAGLALLGFGAMRRQRFGRRVL
ncbi:MAG: PEP-CTERM sorting domain-containing protein [Acidobacteriaceae bacterium]|nr:PEP-CTERM sorting domain-containing protein [Acidobacteriaceae bacterium]